MNLSEMTFVQALKERISDSSRKKNPVRIRTRSGSIIQGLVVAENKEYFVICADERVAIEFTSVESFTYGQLT